MKRRGRSQVMLDDPSHSRFRPTLTEGNVIRIPSGAHIWVGDEGKTIRKSRLGVVEFVYTDENKVWFRDRYGEHFAHISAVEVVNTEDHRLTVRREKLGGHPIAGWNWPLWGYDYRCACGASHLTSREDHLLHLEEVSR